MPYDQDLANRLRELLAEEEAVSEQAMFGGLAFLIRGHMAVAASGQGGLLVRTAPEETERYLAQAGVALMEMGGRSMAGWLRVDAEHARTQPQLSKWVKVGVATVKTLPPKVAKSRK